VLLPCRDAIVTRKRVSRNRKLVDSPLSKERHPPLIQDIPLSPLQRATGLSLIMCR